MRSVANISMPKQMMDLIEEGMSEGKYASKSEFIRMLLRQWKNRKLRQLTRISPTGIRTRAAKTQ